MGQEAGSRRSSPACSERRRAADEVLDAQNLLGLLLLFRVQASWGGGVGRRVFVVPFLKLVFATDYRARATRFLAGTRRPLATLGNDEPLTETQRPSRIRESPQNGGDGSCQV